MAKPYLIGPENDDPNDTPRTEHNEQKNSHKKDHPYIAGSIAVDSILTVIITLLVATDLPIDSLDNHDYQVVSPPLARENSDQPSKNPKIRRLLARFQT